MGLFTFLSGKDPEEYERKGDAYFEHGEIGAAKLEYENALIKLEKKRPGDESGIRRLEEKIIRARESLARAHRDGAAELMDSEEYDDARDLLLLARELTQDQALRSDIDTLMQEITARRTKEFSDGSPDMPEQGEHEAPRYQERDDEYFTTLVSALPEDIRNEYLDYGEPFREGYLALNRGDYERALTLLTAAREERPAGSHMLYEIGTACLNHGSLEEARSAAEQYVKENPLLLRGYHLLCEVLWEMTAFDEAHALIGSSPAELGRSLPLHLLRGETLHRAGRYNEAESFYTQCLDSFGRHETILRALALNHESLGRTQAAHRLYGEIMTECHCSRTRVDPFIKDRYAETAFALGTRTGAILEVYLSLAEEIPEERARYFHRISRIYEDQGFENEALRYRALAEKLEA
ncbi:MAG: tetratricopeptide repeat protein [Deltaproteobacteria bacterium]|nr:tetratricopeptide repeat protein [Deltaproteobacteria bacterium]